jgi:hypothetical protein
MSTNKVVTATEAMEALFKNQMIIHELKRSEAFSLLTNLLSRFILADAVAISRMRNMRIREVLRDSRNNVDTGMDKAIDAYIAAMKEETKND